MAIILHYLPHSVAFGAHYVKVVADIPKLFCDRNVAQSIWFLAIYHLRRYLQSNTVSFTTVLRLACLFGD